MKRLSLAALLPLISLTAHATLIDRGHGLIYDTEQNVTWLQDFSYALTANPDAGTYRAQYSSANDWAANLNFDGFTDWRLPSANLKSDYDTHGDPYTVWSDRVQALYSQQTFDGSTDRGFNNTQSELGHLFDELGNLAKYDASGNLQAGSGLTNTGPFTNMLSTRYYFGDTFFHPSGELYVWTFDFLTGYQSGASQYLEFPVAPMWIAVHDGDIGKLLDDGHANVPEPSSLALLAAGLVGLVATRKRK